MPLNSIDFPMTTFDSFQYFLRTLLNTFSKYPFVLSMGRTFLLSREGFRDIEQRKRKIPSP